jgi:hypothetical protein
MASVPLRDERHTSPSVCRERNALARRRVRRPAGGGGADDDDDDGEPNMRQI